MRLGPLRFLACVALATLAWAVSRVPVVVARAEADIAAVAAWRGERDAAKTRPGARTAEAAAQARVAEAPAHEMPILVHRHSGEGWIPAASQNRIKMAAFVHPRPIPSSMLMREIYSQFTADAPPATLPELHPRPPAALARAAGASTAFDLAAAGYSDLARGDRRAAAREFDNALTADPAAANAFLWRAEVARLRRRWSGEAYLLIRGAGPTGLGVVPLLGGGQSGGSLAYTPDPLARRPVAVVARAAVAHQGAGFGIAGVDRGSLQGALGIRWNVVPGASLTVERLIAGGSSARDAWVLRAAGGATRRVGPMQLDTYAEAGIVGARRRDTFASAQARAVLPLPAGFDAGAGTWASLQDASTTIHRVDIGPTVGWRHGAISARSDWRFRVSGDAAPGSGPALTLSAAF